MLHLLTLAIAVVAATATNRTINLLWPGSSWASIACGTHYQLLASQGYQVQHIIGASGGAASAVMMLSDSNPASLRVLNDTYTQYGKKCDFSTSCWAGVYQHLMRTLDGAFDRVSWR